ncbi:hypothetical protein PENSPDRAFT_270486 [Peniophora sp. CONT]|nr:hypothetical protein PENSPDRAFT_270486 [Peniophora sp. CONT]
MPNWERQAESHIDRQIYIKLFCFVFGVGIWEYITAFGYEWAVYSGRRKYLRTIWLYSGFRFLLLMWLFTLLVSKNGAVHHHCTTMYIATSFTCYVIVSLGSLMIALRVIAIWEHKRLISLLSYGFIILCFVVNMRSLFYLRARYDPVSRSCVAFGSYNHLPCTIAILATDMALMAMMLLGLLRLWEARQLGLVRFLYRQGVLWLALAMIAGHPTVVAAGLGVTKDIYLTAQVFATTALCICATRMYRGLTDYVHVPERC